MTIDLEVGQKIDSEQLKKEGWRDFGQTSRKRTIFIKEEQGKKVGLLHDPNSNKIFLITKL